MTLAPSPQDQALATARYAIEEALMALAVWCPHGLDTSRLTDYHQARDAREHLEAAQAILGRPW